MFDYFTKEDLKELENIDYLEIPISFFRDKKYKHLSTESKLLYALMMDKMPLSEKENLIDDKGIAFVCFPIEEAMTLLGCGQNKAFVTYKELEDAELIAIKTREHGLPNAIYVKNLL